MEPDDNTMATQSGESKEQVVTGDWQYCKPPNEVLVEVEKGGDIIKAEAFYFRDRWRPHWRCEKGISYPVTRFRRWRNIIK